MEIATVAGRRSLAKQQILATSPLAYPTSPAMRAVIVALCLISALCGPTDCGSVGSTTNCTAMDPNARCHCSDKPENQFNDGSLMYSNDGRLATSYPKDLTQIPDGPCL